MVDIGLLVSGSYFMLISFWWLIHITKRYRFCKERNVEFESSASNSSACCRSTSAEGIFKIVSSLTIIIFLLTFPYRGLNQQEYLQNKEVATIFVFYMISGIIDCITKWNGLAFFKGLDYVTLMLFFLIQCMIFNTHVQISELPYTILYTLMLYTCFALTVTTMFELKFLDVVIWPVIRCYLLLTHGTWCLQVFFLIQDKSVMSDTTPNKAMLLGMYFSWHCGVNFCVVLSTWLIINKMVVKRLCCCSSSNGNGATDTVFLENRVHFDYNILDRFESDID